MKILIVAINVFLLVGICRGAAQVGLIEGYAWSSNYEVKGQYGMYTNTQRDQLISAMGAPLNSYVFVPHDDSLDPSVIWTTAQRTAWKNTILAAKDLNITVIMGIRPAYIDDLATTLSIVRMKLTTDFIPAGVQQYILAWDDTPGAGTTAQMELQASLINSLISNPTTITLSGIVPSAYYPGAQVMPFNGTWVQKLEVLDTVPTSVRFYVTGEGIVVSSLSPSDVPALPSGRKFIMWDNWIATDSSLSVTMTFPPSRAASLYTYGYGLNLGFPSQRVIHQVKVLQDRAASQPVVTSTIASQWASYLVAHGFVANSSQSAAATCLNTVITKDTESCSSIISTCPMTSAAFTN